MAIKIGGHSHDIRRLRQFTTDFRRKSARSRPGSLSREAEKESIHSDTGQEIHRANFAKRHHDVNDGGDRGELWGRASTIPGLNEQALSQQVFRTATQLQRSQEIQHILHLRAVE